MKIAYVTADHGTPVFGEKGASIHIQELVNGFADQGHEITILAARVGKRVCALRAEVTKIRAEPVPPGKTHTEPDPQAKRSLGEQRNLAIADAVEEALCALHAESPFDFIYERYSLWSAAGTRAARRLGVPCIVEVNSPLLVEQQKYRRLVFAEKAEAIEAEVFKDAHALIAVSAAVRSYAVAKGADASRVFVVPNAVDIDRFNPAVQARSVPGVEQDFVVGFVGSLKPWHDLKSLLGAFAQLHGEAKHCHLLIVGDGPLRPWIEGYVEGAGLGGAVTITGWVPHEELPGLLQRMDVAVAPYMQMDDFYFSPLKLYEYRAMGKPVVASAVGQIGEAIEDGRTGLHARPGDPGDLAAKIGRLRRDPELRRRLGQAAAKQAGDYTWGGNARRVIDLAGSISRAM